MAKTACVLGASQYSWRVQNVNVIGAGGIGVALGGALARAGWNVTMVDTNEAKLEVGRRHGIEVNGVKGSNLRFTSFAEWVPADRAILLLCTKTYDNPAVLARIPLRHLLVPIQNGFDPVLNESSHPFEGILPLSRNVKRTVHRRGLPGWENCIWEVVDVWPPTSGMS
jgi:hypothetical protein